MVSVTQHIKERQAAGIVVAKEKGIYKGRKQGATKAKPERARALYAKGLAAQELAHPPHGSDEETL